MIKKVSTLFMGEAELILGFNDFLPDGYKITERVCAHSNYLLISNECSCLIEQDIAMHYPVKPAPPKPKPKVCNLDWIEQLQTPPELRYAQSSVSKIWKRFRLVMLPSDMH